ncbi:MAG: hypothetical protein ABEJ72_08735, partial [Candidatus Aenigmatarchaeota archaeon]
MQQPEIKLYSTENWRVKYVEKGSWQETSGDHILEAGYLGSCAFIAAYDPDRSTGYLGHFATVGNDALAEEVGEFVDEVDSELQ